MAILTTRVPAPPAAAGPDPAAHDGQQAGAARTATESAAATLENGPPKRMRALVKTQAGPGLTLDEVPVPEIGLRDVLIRVDMAAICGTDAHIFEWDAWAASRVRPGTVIGHEFMGHVAAVGSAVRGIAVGDRVSGEGHIGCGHCYCCRTGQGHICGTVDIIGVDVDGCFADYVRLPEENVWKLNPSIPDHVGAIQDPMGNAMHTVMADDVSGRSVLIVGAGAVGLLCTAIARAAGAIDIVTLDVNPMKVRLATQMGADGAFDPREPGVEQQLLARTRDGRGFDVMLEVSGSPAGIRTGFRLLRSGGWASLLGIPSADVSFNLAEDVIFKGITIHGINGRLMYETWYQVEDFLIHHRLNVEPVISHRLLLSDYERAFELLRKGEAVKVVLNLAAERGSNGERRVKGA